MTSDVSVNWMNAATIPDTAMVWTPGGAFLMDSQEFYADEGQRIKSATSHIGFRCLDFGDEWMARHRRYFRLDYDHWWQLTMRYHFS